MLTPQVRDNIKEFNYRSEAKQFNIKLWIKESEANVVISKNQISELFYFKTGHYRSEANRFDNDLEFKNKKKSELSFFKITKGKPNQRVR